MLTRIGVYLAVWFPIYLLLEILSAVTEMSNTRYAFLYAAGLVAALGVSNIIKRSLDKTE